MLASSLHFGMPRPLAQRTQDPKRRDTDVASPRPSVSAGDSPRESSCLAGLAVTMGRRVTGSEAETGRSPSCTLADARPPQAACSPSSSSHPGLDPSSRSQRRPWLSPRCTYAGLLPCHTCVKSPPAGSLFLPVDLYILSPLLYFRGLSGGSR